MPFKTASHKVLLLLLACTLLLAVFLFRNRIFSLTKFQDYYTIGVILNSVELSQEDLEAIYFIIGEKVKQINAAGGVAGRELRVLYLDDKSNAEIAYQKVKETIDDPHLLGYVGCWSSSRAYAISALIGPKGVPFIGEYALTPLFDKYPSMFTAENGIKEQGTVLQYLLKKKFKRAAYIGKDGDLYSLALLQRMQDLAAENPDFQVVDTYHYPLDHAFTDAELGAVAKELMARETDFLLVSIESGAATAIILGLQRAGLKVPVFVGLGDAGFVESLAHAQGQEIEEMYDINIAGVSGALNLRLQEVILSLRNDLDYSEELEFQLSFGARFADAIGMMVEAAKSKQDTSPATIRENTVQGLHNYIGGKQIYRGWYADWYFMDTKSGAGSVFLAWKPSNLTHHVLAPEQVIFVEDTLREIPVIYTHIDLVQIDQVQDTEGTFYANFYFELFSSSPFSIDQIDFTNAARSETSHARLLDIKLVRSKRPANKTAMYSSLYKVSGKFLFDPDLRNYPFDQQKFIISFQPGSALQPFLIQPPVAALRDSVFDSGGWKLIDHFVGYNQDIISFINPLEEYQQALPFYNFSYIYILKRARVDFVLKILTPLLVILVITYFSVYIPMYKFETLEAIQVTSLLASIALYFSAYKPEMEYATISDRIFIFTYLMITSLIGTSILRYVRRKKHDAENKLARAYQLYIFPLILIAFTIFVASA
ncbi:ABC transporter substrate-binding protein [Pontibacter sp. E15-1]|uniref:ABC transporter substrate-binding protein n=1 Tax=Pontibacter sp. E15-1 TaxID=2919918 RepID=UPI001F4F5728|nr:ABC transporter substrate-binding protein [Pontibacter sp. E15-1]MCJ8163934.1 ABC transporter substrate-binding protein [Pontibacter sp. E15-1]